MLTVEGAYPGAKIDDDELPGTVFGCSGHIRYAMPDCTTLAEMSGRVATKPEVQFDDDDYFFNVCPFKETMRRFPFESTLTTELRGAGSFDNFILGRIHTEVQDCRFYNGQYVIDEPSFASPQVFEARPGLFDIVSAAGDWAWEALHRENGGWTEIHEARVLAVTRPIAVGSNVSYSFVSGFFADKSLQRSALVLDLRVPPAEFEPQRHTFLDCFMPDDVKADRPSTKVPGQIIPAAEDPTVSNRCKRGRTINSMVFAPEPDSVNQSCRFQARRTGGSTILPFNCQVTCGGNEFEDCSQLAAAVAVRAEWLDPADTWVCNNCACADPSALGAMISAPVQGCAQAGLDPQNPADQATACSQVCDGFICGTG